MGMISWWYSRGWSSQWSRIAERWSRTAELFSIGQLFSTLFAPYRQISAGKLSGSIAAVVRAALDQLVSRTIGAFVRFFTIIIGVIVLIVQAIYEVLIAAVWWLVPLLPIVGVVLFAIGWVPQWK